MRTRQPTRLRNPIVDPVFSEFPQTVGVEITGRCNLRCKHCYNHSGPENTAELPFEVIEGLLDEMVAWKVPTIRISGGEPTMHSDFWEVLTACRSRGIEVAMHTNGVLSSTTLERLKAESVGLIFISIDGLEKTNDAIRGPMTFRRATESARVLKQAGQRVILSVHVGAGSQHEIEGLAALAASIGVDLKIAPIRPIGRAITELSSDLIDSQYYMDIVRQVVALRSKYPGIRLLTDFDILDRQPASDCQRDSSRASCKAGRTMVHINYDGCIYPCAFFATPDHEFAAGNLHHDRVSDVWNTSPLFEPFRIHTKSAQCQSCAHYRSHCSGGCPAIAYFSRGTIDAHDPTCFSDLLSMPGSVSTPIVVQQASEPPAPTTIKHVLRQECEGGYWFIRAEGRVIELDEHEYRHLAAVITSGFGDRHKDRPAMTGHGALAAEVHRQGLLDPGWWAHVRHVPLDVGRETLPTDAAVAPKRIYFEITRRCNLRCTSCFNESGRPLPNELTHDEILGVNRQAHELGVFEIRYTGGECTLIPGFPDIVADARRKGIYVSVGTNAVYTDAQLEWLPYCGIDWFIISLDGDRETNDRVRGTGTFDRVVKSIEVLARDSQAKIRLNMVVANHNITCIEAVAAVCEEYGVDSLNLIPLRPYGRSTVELSEHQFRQDDFYAFIKEVNRLRSRFPGVTFSTTIDLLDPTATTSHDLIVQKKHTCAAGVEACVIGPQGHVYGCSYSPASYPDSIEDDAGSLFIAGNIREHRLRDIWRDSSCWTVFRNLDQYKNPKCHTCGHYRIRCSGSCQIMAYAQMRHLEEVERGEARLCDFCDPYCFVDLLDEQTQARAGTGLIDPVIRGMGDA